MIGEYHEPIRLSRPCRDRLPIRECRILAGKTQEEFADLVNVSVRSLRRYEYGEEETPDDVMVAAATIANCPLLLYRHVKEKYMLDEEILPSVEEVPLAQAVVSLLNELNELEAHHVASDLLAMARDGKLDASERTDFAFIMKRLDGVRHAVEMIRYCRKE